MFPRSAATLANMWRGRFGNAGPNPSKGHLRKRTPKADPQSLFRLSKKALRMPIGRIPTFQIGGPPNNRRSACSTSGVLSYVCERTGNVAVVLCANSGRSTRQGEPPTVATADLCQRSIRQPGAPRAPVDCPGRPLDPARTGESFRCAVRGYHPPNILQWVSTAGREHHSTSLEADFY